MLGTSQEKVGDELGVTFQQVQKYEKGTYSISASPLLGRVRASVRHSTAHKVAKNLRNSNPIFILMAPTRSKYPASQAYASAAVWG